MELEEIKTKIIPILRRYDVEKAALFGSYVKGEEREDSDIDILVKFKGEKSLLEYLWKNSFSLKDMISASK